MVIKAVQWHINSKDRQQTCKSCCNFKWTAGTDLADTFIFQFADVKFWLLANFSVISL